MIIFKVFNENMQHEKMKILIKIHKLVSSSINCWTCFITLQKLWTKNKKIEKNCKNHNDHDLFVSHQKWFKTINQVFENHQNNYQKMIIEWHWWFTCRIKINYNQWWNVFVHDVDYKFINLIN